MSGIRAVNSAINTRTAHTSFLQVGRLRNMIYLSNEEKNFMSGIIFKVPCIIIMQTDKMRSWHEPEVLFTQLHISTIFFLGGGGGDVAFIFYCTI